MKATELRDMSKEELSFLLEESKTAIFDLRNDVRKTKKNDSPNELRKTRKTIARILTVLREKNGVENE